MADRRHMDGEYAAMRGQLEGYWLNSRSGAYRRIDEHRRWISRKENACSLGLDPRLFALIPQPNTARDRLRVLLAAMEGGLIRVRRHAPGEIAFEHTIPYSEALPAIQAFLADSGLAGPLTMLTATDLAAGLRLQTTYDAFAEAMRSEPNGLAAQAEPAVFAACSLDEIEKRLRDIRRGRKEQGPCTPYRG